MINDSRIFENYLRDYRRAKALAESLDIQVSNACSTDISKGGDDLTLLDIHPILQDILYFFRKSDRSFEWFSKRLEQPSLISLSNPEAWQEENQDGK